MYLARKELAVRHQEEYQQILDKVMLDNGIITRRIRKDNQEQFTKLFRELTAVEQVYIG
jgi:dynactin complex subunit